MQCEVVSYVAYIRCYPPLTQQSMIQYTAQFGQILSTYNTNPFHLPVINDLHDRAAVHLNNELLVVIHCVHLWKMTYNPHASATTNKMSQMLRVDSRNSLTR